MYIYSTNREVVDVWGRNNVKVEGSVDARRFHFHGKKKDLLRN